MFQPAERWGRVFHPHPLFPSGRRPRDKRLEHSQWRRRPFRVAIAVSAVTVRLEEANGEAEVGQHDCAPDDAHLPDTLTATPLSISTSTTDSFTMISSKDDTASPLKYWVPSVVDTSNFLAPLPTVNFL